MAKVVLLTILFLLVIGVGLLIFADGVGVEVGEDSAAVDKVKDVWAELTAPVSFDLDQLVQ